MNDLELDTFVARVFENPRRVVLLVPPVYQPANVTHGQWERYIESRRSRATELSDFVHRFLGRDVFACEMILGDAHSGEVSRYDIPRAVFDGAHLVDTSGDSNL